MNLLDFASTAGDWLDAIGVAVIVAGFLLSTIIIVMRIFRTRSVHHIYRAYRQNMARSLLIGLEFLLAGDIVRTVAGDLTFNTVLILAIIVIVRSFLGIEFEMEVDGFWPWQRAKFSRKNRETN